MKKLQHSQLLHDFMSQEKSLQIYYEYFICRPALVFPISTSKPLLRLKQSDIQYTYVCIQG